ncbi:hypothetical protein C1I60_03235 [Paenibacillus terrae]|uniref:YfhO family protein n=1 Tax=Paenibacillus terrae TaxID=159743 RepID=A0A4U2Q233_9BACL|nr:hypothetical protein [Paenibacillus terrae]TKH46155.1 hypothetical protein C1I60_03235 [Paenibacillus terrae]
MPKISKKEYFLFLFLIILIFSISIFVRTSNLKPYSNITNIDASYHVLLTIDALKENSIKDHLFLPIVSLGPVEDKYISWGATVSDKKGNYFYTSFPQLGFSIPYLFFSLLGLNTTIINLMYFNLIIHFICSIFVAILCFLLISKITNNKKLCLYGVIIAVTVYIFNLESLFSHGVIYWSQSLFQVFWISQLIVFNYLLKLKNGNNVYMYLLFFFLSFCAPATEWTGYLSNFIFLICLFFLGIKSKNNLTLLSIIISSTLLAVASFLIPFWIAIGPKALINTLESRFFARNIANSIGWRYLFEGYWESFGPYLILTGLIVLFCLLNRNIRPDFISNFKKLKIWFFLFLFPIFENVIMKQHAIIYSFDRLKLVLLIILIILVGVASAKSIYIKKMSILIVLSAVVTLVQFYNSHRVWEEKDLAASESLIEYINSKYHNAVFYNNGDVRGYANLLLHRGVYEKIRDRKELADDAVQVYKDKNIVWLLGKSLKNGLFSWGNAIIYDRNQGEIIIVGIIPKNVIEGAIPIDNNVVNLMTDNNVSSLEVNNKILPIYRIAPQGIIHLDSKLARKNENSIFKISISFKDLNITTADFTDSNWYLGVHRNNSTILLENNMETNQVLEKKPTILIDRQGKEYHILNISINGPWIQLSLKEKDIQKLIFPNSFTVK